MKQFIKKLIFFAIPILIAGILMELLLRSVPNTYDIKNNLLTKNASNIEVVLLGTSHTFSGINPSQFGQFTVNIANNSQSLYCDLMILEKYLDRLSSLKMVVFEINFFSFSYNLDKGPESWRNKFYFQSYDIKPQTEILNICDKIRLLNLSSDEILLLFKNYHLYQEYKSNLGFAKNDILPKLISDKTAKFKFDQFRNEFMNSDPQDLIAKFRETLSKLAKRNVSIIFVQLPVSEPLTEYIQNYTDSADRYSFNKIINDFIVKNLNYIGDKRFADSLFIDSDHLSYDGARFLTSILIKDLEN